MNTCTRRFILRLAVGLLAFLLGVTAAWALGGFRPFSPSVRSERYYNSSGSLGQTPEPGVVYPVYREHGCRMHSRRFSELPLVPPPAPLADAPVPPSPPSVLR
jgi:hypothetical protein